MIDLEREYRKMYYGLGDQPRVYDYEGYKHRYIMWADTLEGRMVKLKLHLRDFWNELIQTLIIKD